jgi:hypothetical protein
MPLKKREQAGGIRSGVWVMAPGEWSATQSGEGLMLVRPRVQAASGGKTRGGCETGGSGRSSSDVRDNITLAERRTRGEAACSSTRGPAPTCLAIRRDNGYKRSSSGNSTIWPAKPGCRLGRAEPGSHESDRFLEAVLGKTHRTEFQRGAGETGHGAC